MSQDDPNQLDLDNVNNALLTAEVESVMGREANAIARVQGIRKNIQSNALTMYYEPQLARANFIEGYADLRNGDLLNAIPVLNLALTERESGLDPHSLEISQIETTLAECYLAQGQVVKARMAATAAAAINAAHSELGPQYGNALKELQMKIEQQRDRHNRPHIGSI